MIKTSMKKGCENLASLATAYERNQSQGPLNTKVMPTSLTKRACEEKMKSCFFNILIAQDTIVVVSFKLVLN